MNYKRLIHSTLHSSKNPSIIALFAGLAAGAALSILFAPKSGRKTRTALCDGASDFVKQVKNRFAAASARHTEGFKGHIFEDIRETIKETADHLQGPEKQRKDPTLIKVSSVGTTAWKKYAEEK